MDKTIWIGLDVHAKQIAVARLTGEADQPEITELGNESKLLRRAFKKWAREGEIRCCYEAGPCGYEVFRLLDGMGIRCDVIAPSLIPRRPGDRVKTDRRDAAKLARLLRAGELTSIRVPTEDQEAVRDLVRARDDARRDRMAARHRLTKFLLRHGRRFAEGKNWTLRFWRWVAAQEFGRPAETASFEHYVDRVRYLDAAIKALDGQIEELANTPAYRDQVALLSCLRGISTLAAMVILSELYDLQRFDSPRQMMAFIGIVPSEHSTGDKRRQGGITKTGNGFVRRILVEASWAYRRSASITSRQRSLLADRPPAVADLCRRANSRLTKRYRILVGRGKSSPVAMTAIARELCGFIWALTNLHRVA